jgi:hypothetical protein
MKKTAIVITLLITINLFAADKAPQTPLTSLQFETTSINAKSGKAGTYHKYWINEGKVRIEEYGNPSLPLQSILLTDGSNEFIFSPRTKNATAFGGVSILAHQAAVFVTLANLKQAYGPLLKDLPDEQINGVTCHAYKAGGLVIDFDATTGFGVRYASSKEALTGGTFITNLRFPADKTTALYTLPEDAHLNNPGFKPGLPGQ